MLFSDLTFLFLFFPAFLICYFLAKKRKTRNIILLIFSLAFYAYGEPVYVFLMLFSIIGNFFLAKKIDSCKNKEKRKKIFIMTIFLNILLLVIFKYTGFLIDSFNKIFSLNITIPNILLPIGISFYTFQIMSYVISVYKKEVTAQKNIINLGCYITAFPQLIAGPIVRYETVSEELEKREENITDFSYGIRRFIIGLAKKVLIADYLGYIASSIFSTGEVGFLPAWLGMISYALQIYYDFSGYSDMAIGLGRMMGFHFLENFNYPYVAKSITEFWRRWHISLSSFFKDYVYIPLGGNRVSKRKLVRNLLIVWALTGLWHGASWNFILWGLYYGIILIIEKFFLKKYLDKIPSILSHIYALIIIIIGWVIFNNESLPTMLDILKSMFMLNGLGNIDYIKYLQLLDIKYILAIVLGAIFAFPVAKNLLNNNHKYLKDTLLIILFLISIISILNSTYSPFIYFRF